MAMWSGSFVSIFLKLFSTETYLNKFETIFFEFDKKLRHLEF